MPASRRRKAASSSSVLPALFVVPGVLLWALGPEFLRVLVIGAFVAAAIAVPLAVLGRRRRRTAHERYRVQVRAFRDIDGLSGPQFERLVAELLRRTGWADVRVSGGANDRGADVTARDGAGRLLVVQCKRYAAAVGSKDVQAFLGTHRLVHGAHHSWFVTTSRFTAEAQALGRMGGVRLVDREALAEWLRESGMLPAA